MLGETDNIDALEISMGKCKHMNSLNRILFYYSCLWDVLCVTLICSRLSMNPNLSSSKG